MKMYRIIQNTLITIAALIILSLISFVFLHIKPVVVVSGSMEPEIATGSVVFIDEDDRNVQKGDIIAYQTGKLTVTHRIIDEKGGNYITKGDANDTVDLSPISQEQIIGTVIYHLPKVGYVLMFIKSTRGMIIIGTIFIIFVLIGVLINDKERRG